MWLFSQTLGPRSSDRPLGTRSNIRHRTGRPNAPAVISTSPSNSRNDAASSRRFGCMVAARAVRLLGRGCALVFFDLRGLPHRADIRGPPHRADIRGPPHRADIRGLQHRRDHARFHGFNFRLSCNDKLTADKQRHVSCHDDRLDIVAQTLRDLFFDLGVKPFGCALLIDLEFVCIQFISRRKIGRRELDSGKVESGSGGVVELENMAQLVMRFGPGRKEQAETAFCGFIADDNCRFEITQGGGSCVEEVKLRGVVAAGAVTAPLRAILLPAMPGRIRRAPSRSTCRETERAGQGTEPAPRWNGPPLSPADGRESLCAASTAQAKAGPVVLAASRRNRRSQENGKPCTNRRTGSGARRGRKM